jgi:hypothetical protein
VTPFTRHLAHQKKGKTALLMDLIPAYDQRDDFSRLIQLLEGIESNVQNDPRGPNKRPSTAATHP